MSDLDRRRGLRALIADPSQFDDDELDRLLVMAEAEFLHRSGVRVSWAKVLVSTKALCIGASHRLARALDQLELKHDIVSLLSVSPHRLMWVDGFGEGSMLAVFVSLAAHGARFGTEWRAAPRYNLTEYWSRVLDAQKGNPAGLLDLAKGGFPDLWRAVRNLPREPEAAPVSGIVVTGDLVEP